MLGFFMERFMKQYAIMFGIAMLAIFVSNNVGAVSKIVGPK